MAKFIEKIKEFFSSIFKSKKKPVQPTGEEEPKQAQEETKSE